MHLRSLLPVIVMKQITTANFLASTIVEISSFQSTWTSPRLNYNKDSYLNAINNNFKQSFNKL